MPTQTSLKLGAAGRCVARKRRPSGPCLLRWGQAEGFLDGYGTCPITVLRCILSRWFFSRREGPVVPVVTSCRMKRGDIVVDVVTHVWVRVGSDLRVHAGVGDRAANGDWEDAATVAPVGLFFGRWVEHLNRRRRHIFLSHVTLVKQMYLLRKTWHDFLSPSFWPFLWRANGSVIVNCRCQIFNQQNEMLCHVT